MFPHTKPPAGTQINPLHPLSNGLVGCWLFNEGAGSLANDISGYKNHGRLTNMAPNVQGSGWGSDGLEFDGVDDYVDCGNDSSLDITRAITIEAWVNPKATDESAIIERGYYTGDGGYMLWYKNGEIRFYIQKASRSFTTINTNEWTHIVAVYDGAFTYLYKNGVLVDKDAYTDGLGDTSRNVQIGRYGILDAYVFNGSIDSVRTYNRALSAGEAAWLYREPYAMFEPTFNPAIYGAVFTKREILNLTSTIDQTLATTSTIDQTLATTSTIDQTLALSSKMDIEAAA